MGQAERAWVINVCKYLRIIYTERHAPVNDDDAVQTVGNPMYCGIWPSGLRRIYTEFEGRGEGIKYAWYCKIKMTQWIKPHWTKREHSPEFESKPGLVENGVQKGLLSLLRGQYTQVWKPYKVEVLKHRVNTTLELMLDIISDV